MNSKKEYGRRHTDFLLMEALYDVKILKEYKRRFWEQQQYDQFLLFSEASEFDTAQYQKALEQINNDVWDKSPKHFHASIMQAKPKQAVMLTPYTPDEFSKMDCYKALDFNAGFCLKDGDIVSVHNNTPILGLGNVLMQAAIRNGGHKLDHFDGFLSSIYEKAGFKVVGKDAWNDDYAPPGWKYKPIDFFDADQCVYAAEALELFHKGIPMEEWPTELKDAKERYDAGRPDIIYRNLG